MITLAEPHSASPILSARSHRSLGELVDALQAAGRYSFRREEALDALGVSADAFKKAVSRLTAKRRVVAPRRGFFVIVPLEYRSAGAPPASWFVDDLMAFHGRPYYVGALSAAAFHGAAHQQPQQLQVVTARPLRPTVVGRSALRFLYKRELRSTPTAEIKTETGSLRVSTPEATAFDLVRYVASAGHLSNVATVLAELAELIDPQRLAEAALRGVELSVVQRTGYLLELVGAAEVTEPLARWIAQKRPRAVLLRPDRPAAAQKSSTWRIHVNETVEVDL